MKITGTQEDENLRNLSRREKAYDHQHTLVRSNVELRKGKSFINNRPASLDGFPVDL